MKLILSLFPPQVLGPEFELTPPEMSILTQDIPRRYPAYKCVSREKMQVTKQYTLA